MKRLAALLFLSVVFLSACASSKWTRTPVVKQHEFNVTVEQRQDNGTGSSQKYAHPYEIDLVDFKKLMGDLTYTEKAGLIAAEKQSPVFQAVEIDRLAPVLADTLATAAASQRIRLISFNHGKALLFSVSRKTEGVMFIEPDGRLNIAFNFINSDRQPNETTAVFPNYATGDPLKIKTSDTPLSPIAPYAKLHTYETGRLAPMWVVADLLKLHESIPTAPGPTVNKTEDVSPAVAAKTEAMRTPVEKTVPVPISEDLFKEKLKEDLKNKLKYLKELMNEGLISEKDYNAKKMELLEKIN